MARNISRSSPKQRRNIRTSPHDFAMLGQGVGLGQLAQVPTNLLPYLTFYEETLCLPVTDAQLDAFFSRFENGLFKFQPPTQDGVCNVSTNLSLLTTISPTIICGMCIVAVGEGQNFCQSGVLVPCPDGGTAVAPPAVMGSGCDGGALASAGQVPAVMSWGGPTWQFIESFFRTYNLQVLINDECLVVDLPASDVGMCEIAPSFKGAGDSCIGTMPMIRETNQHARDNNIDCQFLPVNTLVTTDCAGVCASIDAPPPSAAVTWGHTMFTGRNPKLFRFKNPLILVPAVTSLGVEFDLLGSNSEIFKNQMRAAAVPGSKALGATECGMIGPSECFTTESPTGGVGIGAGHWPGGKVTIGIRLMGFRVSYAFCVDLLQQYVIDRVPLLANIMGTQWVQGLAGKMRNDGLSQDDPRMKLLNGLASGSLAGIPGYEK
jgi:hypothetical protein